jgi:hypothetical protein
MRVRAHFANVAQMDVTLTITMPLGEWRKLAADLSKDYPGFKLAEHIRSVTRGVDQTVESREVEP